MKITPLEIRQREFEKTFRGYNIEEVDTFLSNLSQEWERVLSESKMLRMQLEIAEKEAAKLREIEMTIYKALKTAEDTGKMITEQATQQADTQIQDAKFLGDKIVTDAKQKAEDIIKQAEDKARFVREEVLGEIKVLERDFKALEVYKSTLLSQLKNISNATLEQVDRFENKYSLHQFEKRFVEAEKIASGETEAKPPIAPQYSSTTIAQELSKDIPVYAEEQRESNISSVDAEIVVGEEVPTRTILSSAVNHITTETFENEARLSVPKIDDLTLIFGIDHPMAMLLNEADIFTFRDLAVIPVYKIEELLATSGADYSHYDPSEWTKQAKLAAEGRWEDLEALKYFLGGKQNESDDEPENTEVSESLMEVEEEDVYKPSAAPKSSFSSLTTILKREAETNPFFNQSNYHETNPGESINEEMQEKVNKVKAAIRKAMGEKTDFSSKDTTPLPTVNDVIGKSIENQVEKGSFFDNL